jgi:hypothetical protein
MQVEFDQTKRNYPRLVPATLGADLEARSFTEKAGASRQRE